MTLTETTSHAPLRLVNLTAHPITLIDPTTGDSHTIPSSGVARVESKFSRADTLVLDALHIPVVTPGEREVVDLPAPEEGTTYIVSGLVASTVARADVVSPVQLVREGTSVIGARALLRYPEAPARPMTTEPPRPMPQVARDSRSSSFKDQAKAIIEAKTGGPLTKRHGDTYETITGAVLHIRSSRGYPRGGIERSYWFGLPENTWNDGEFFVLVCADEALLIVPVHEMRRYHDLIPSAKEGTERQPTIWFTSQGVCEFRAAGVHVDFDEWRDYFDLL
jgi:hypothetical protein